MHTAMGTACAAFVIDVFARRIVERRDPTSMTTSSVLDAVNQAICQRRPALGALTRHSGRGLQYLSIRYAERLAETVIGSFKTEIIKHLGPWKTKGQFEWETTKWLHWCNKDRLHGAIGYQTPNEKEDAFRQQKTSLKKQRKCCKKNTGKPGATQCFQEADIVC